MTRSSIMHHSFDGEKHVRRVLSVVLLLMLAATCAEAQKEFDGLRGTHRWMMFSDAPNALYHHIRERADSFMDARSAKVGALKTLSDWKEWQRWIQSALRDAVGPFPEKTPLNARITSVHKKDGYRVENIVFESQPGFYVTSSLFIPDGMRRNDKAPAIIYCSGHSASGYRSRGYQHFIINLVRKGFIVFAFDPVGQGERLGYLNAETGGSVFRWPTWEHSYPGAQLFMTGNSLARYMIWDGIRAVDYLLTRGEVDPDRIGIGGRSGGGTQSAYIAAFDERIKAVAPENYITNFKWLFASMGPQDAEQNFFGGIARGLDMADILLARAPKPAMVVTTTRDMFPIQGAIETSKEVSRLYQAYGKAPDFSMITDDAAHASTKSNREQVYAFFQKHLDNPGDPTDEETKPFEPEELQVTETGQVSTSLGGATVFSLNLHDVGIRREKLQRMRENGVDHDAIIRSAKKLSGYLDPGPIGTAVFTGQIQRGGYTIRKHFVKGEGDYAIPYLLLTPEVSNGNALIYLNPLGKAAASSEGGEMEWFVKKGFTVLAPDIVGTGEMGPGDFRGDSYIDSVSYNLWFASMAIGRSIAGIQAGDVVRLARMLSASDTIKEIYAVARRELAPALLHAAAFDDAIAHVALIEPYSDYHSVVTTREYDPHFVQSTVPGSIGVYDLPDLIACLAPRKVMLSGVTDGSGKVTQGEPGEEELYGAYERWLSGE